MPVRVTHRYCSRTIRHTHYRFNATTGPVLTGSYVVLHEPLFLKKFTALSHYRRLIDAFQGTEDRLPQNTDVERLLFNHVVDRFGSVEAILLTDLLTHSV